MVRNVSEHDIGIKVLYDPPSDAHDTDPQSVVDIVAVHGLGAHPDDTWCKKVDDGSYVNWLKDLHMLPVVVPNARIMRYGYESWWFGENAICQKYVGKLKLQAGYYQLATLTAAQEYPLRPLVFVAHCFGGLVVLKTLVDAKRDDKKWPGIFVSTTGLTFFGTPFRGAGGLNQAEMLRAAESQYEDNSGLVQGAALSILAPGSEPLADLMDMFFETRQEAHKALVACFYELKPSNVGAIVGGTRVERFVVDETSGCLDQTDSTEKYSLSRNHFNMNKFGRPDEEDFETVCEAIKNFVALAPQLLAARAQPKDMVTYYEVPNLYVAHFIGRDNIIEILDSEFPSSARSLSRPRVLVLRALGGQGKSQLALEYCRTSKASGRFHGIFWVDATSKATATRGFGDIATVINKSLKRYIPDSDAKISFVKETLENWTEPWLIVFDNYDRPDVFEDIQHFFPLNGQGAILVTSRHEGTSALGKLIELPPLSEDEALELLLREPKYRQTQESRGEGCQIVKKLGYLALAIDQAAAYIMFTKLPLSQFISSYEDRKRDILEHTPKVFWKYRENESVFTTWEMSFQLIGRDKEYRKHVEHFITLAAFLGPSNIREDLFHCYRTEKEYPPSWAYIFSAGSLGEARGEDYSPQRLDCVTATSVSSKEETWSSKCYRDLVFNLRQLSLLENTITGADGTGISFSLHPLVKDWLQVRASSNKQQDYVLEAIGLLATFLGSPLISTATPLMKQEVLAHMDACVSNDQQFVKLNGLGSEALHHSTIAFGAFYSCEGHYENAKRLFQRLLNDYKSRLGELDSRTLSSMAWLASTHRNRGRWNEAEKLEVQVLEAGKRVLGPEHPNTLTSMANLVSTYWEQGRWNEAEELEVQVLEASKRLLGPEHPAALASMANLAATYSYQGRWKRAEELDMQALESRKRVLGPEHPDTLTSMANLAATYRHQGRWNKAEELGVQVLEAGKRVLGPEHPDTLSNMANLAATYRHQGRWKRAEELEVQVLETRKRVLGPGHPDTLTSMANLAATYRHQGRWNEAEELEAQVLEASKGVLGPEHPATLTSMANLAATYWEQGRWNETEELEVQVLEANKRVLGPEHPDTLTSMASLAATYRHQGRWNEAEELEVQALEAEKRVLGPEHPDTLTSMANLAATYRHQGRWNEAEELEVQVLEASKTVLGLEHPDTLGSMANLAATYRHQGRWKRAEELEVQVLEASKRVLGLEHPATLSNMANLAATYWKQGRWNEAEELEVQVLEASKRVLGPEHPATLTSMANLAATYRHQGRWKRAEELEVQVLGASKRVLGLEHPATLGSMANLASTYRHQGRWNEKF